MDSSISNLNAEIRYLERQLVQSKIGLAQSKADLDTCNLESQRVQSQIDSMFDNTSPTKQLPNQIPKSSELAEIQSHPPTSDATKHSSITVPSQESTPLQTEEISIATRSKSPKEVKAMKSPMSKIFTFHSKTTEDKNDPSYADRTYKGGKQLFKGVAKASKGMASMFYSKITSISTAPPEDQSTSPAPLTLSQ